MGKKNRQAGDAHRRDDGNNTLPVARTATAPNTANPPATALTAPPWERDRTVQQELHFNHYIQEKMSKCLAFILRHGNAERAGLTVVYSGDNYWTPLEQLARWVPDSWPLIHWTPAGLLLLVRDSARNGRLRYAQRQDADGHVWLCALGSRSRSHDRTRRAIQLL